MSSRLIYSTESGTPTNADNTPVIEHTIATRVRINDARSYGLKTAAKITHDKVMRERFQVQRAAAIARQKEREAAKRAQRIAELDKQIARVSVSLLRGNATDPAKVTNYMNRLVAKRTELTQKQESK